MLIMKRLAIFDFDGTLFDSVCDVVISFNRALELHDLPTLTRDEYIPCLGGNIDEIVALVLGDNCTPENHKIVKRDYLNFYNSSKKELTVPFNGAKRTLLELQKNDVLLAINSNRLTYSLEEFVEKYFSDIDFTDIQGHEYPNPSKPDPYGINQIIEKAKISPDEALYIGDSKTDIETAKNAGIDCIIVKWGYGNPEVWKDEYILGCVDDFDEIINYF